MLATRVFWVLLGGGWWLILTPAMAVGISDHIGDIEEIIRLLDD